MKTIALWITGLPGSGKSSVAEGIKKLHPDFVLLRMDDFRKILTPEPTYSDFERDIVYRCLVYSARLLTENGHSVIIDATGHRRKWRDLARRLIPGYGELYLKCPVQICRDRESGRPDTHGAPRGIYEKAGAGWPVPGVATPYEEPLSPELMIEMDRHSLSETIALAECLIRELQSRSS